MNTAILNKELVLLLRQKRVFVLAGALYSVLVISVSVHWARIAELADRASVSRALFYTLVAVGYFIFLTFHALQSSIRIMSYEMEAGTATLLKAAPLSSISFVFQKLLTPLAIEWLIFIGSLPFLSLVFILGGVPPDEFLYQIANLAIWLNTVILIGLFVGSRGADTLKTTRTAWALLFLLVFAPPFLSTAVSISTMTADGSSGPIALSHFLPWLSLISPIGMVGSYELIGTTNLGSTYAPALPGWIGHLILQALLFLGTVRNWKRLSFDLEAPQNFSEVKGFRGFLSWLKRGRRTHSSFSEGWRVFHDLEEREVYRHWKPRRRFAIWIILSLTVLMVLGGHPAVILVAFMIGLAMLMATVGFSSNSLRKEIRRGTSIFLLSAPIDPTDMIFGKWHFYMRQGFAIWSVGVLSTFAAMVLSSIGLISPSDPISLIRLASVSFGYVSLLCFIPFLSIFRLADNVTLYPKSLPYLVLVGLLCCPPFGLMTAAALTGAGLIDVNLKSLRFFPSARAPITLLGWICFVGCISNLFLFPFSGTLLFGGVIYSLILTFDLTILPLASGLYLWILFCEKSDKWWRMHLYPSSAGSYRKVHEAFS
ncbi:MAG: hypothetical protein KC931_03880 [Candidatus Omnitrophica bacterium]|nr:hypothetical protein [Candidatus Omnitrophota bacterium]